MLFFQSIISHHQLCLHQSSWPLSPADGDEKDSLFITHNKTTPDHSPCICQGHRLENSSTCFDGGSKWSTRRRHTQARGEHLNSTQKDPSPAGIQSQDLPAVSLFVLICYSHCKSAQNQVTESFRHSTTTATVHHAHVLMISA